jgi:hypothetical protein
VAELGRGNYIVLLWVPAVVAAGRANYTALLWVPAVGAAGRANYTALLWVATEVVLEKELHIYRPWVVVLEKE